jgi:hypothetical protein
LIRGHLRTKVRYKEAEIGNAVYLKTTAPEPLSLNLENTYAPLNEFDWTNA